MSRYELLALALGGIQTLVFGLGFVLAYRKLRLLQRDASNSVELSARQNAMQLIARYSEPGFVERRLRLYAGESGSVNRLEWQYILNFFEELAIAVKHRTANELLLQDFFGTILRDWMNQESMLNAIIDSRRQDPAMFENALNLYRDWEGGRGERLRIDQIPELS